MSAPNGFEQARNGDLAAIAAFLTTALQAQNISVYADWQHQRLNLRLTAANLLDQDQTITLLQPHVQTLFEGTAAPAIRVFGYQTNQPMPLWHQSLVLEGGSASPQPRYHTAMPEATTVDHFLVCGLGSLGQYCVFNLKRFALKPLEIQVTAIDQVQPTEWEVPDLPRWLEHSLIIADCREDDVLLQAGIHRCRAMLIVTSNDTVNVETAIAARRLNPNVRLVVRSSRQNLNQLLRQQLGNFVAFEPTELPVTAFALAGIGSGILGHFKLGDCQLQIVEQQVAARDFRFDQLLAGQLHKKTYRLLSHQSGQALPSTALASDRTFHQWHPETQVLAGDRIAYIEVAGQTASRRPLGQAPRSSSMKARSQPVWKHAFHWIRTELGAAFKNYGRWIRTQRNHQMVIIGLLTALLLWIFTTIVLKLNLAGMTWVKAMSNAVILLLGGYSDVFGGIEPTDPSDQVPVWLNFFALLVNIVSLLFILGIFGLITDSLLTARFDFLRKRPPIPKQNHIIIVGFGRLGQQVANLLQQFRQPVVAMTQQVENSQFLINIPLVVGDFMTELVRANPHTAKSIMLLTDDQMLNLEVALMARNTVTPHHALNLVIRTYNQRFSESLHQLLPDAKAMAAYALSAEAFAGAAFGENILSLFRLNDRTILVTEYVVAASDTLVNQLLSEVAYGYGVVPIFHQKKHPTSQDTAEGLMPSDDVRLEVGDRLVVLASLNGLRRIEHGEKYPAQRWILEAKKPLNAAVLLDAGAILHRISGCHLDSARIFMNHLPNSLELLLYPHQAYRLHQELSRHLPVTLSPICDPMPSG